MSFCRTWPRAIQGDGAKCAGCSGVFTSPHYRRIVEDEDGKVREYHADPFGENCLSKIPVAVPINT